MIELIAHEDATIEIVKNEFPLGERDTALIHIEDSIISDEIKVIKTGTTDPKYNFYSYGDFEDKENALKYIHTELNTDAVVEIQDGVGYNLSRGLYCKASSYGLGKAELVADMGIIKDSVKYVFSCWVKLDKNSKETSLDLCVSDSVIKTINLSADGNWTFIREELSAELCHNWEQIISGVIDANFKISINMPQNGQLYLDDISLFDSQYEINNTDCSGLKAEIKVLNPCQPNNYRIDKITKWDYSEENGLSVTLNIPPTTNVDFADNLLCKFMIYLTLPKRVSYLDNVVYNKANYTLYESEDFTLRGYMIPFSVVSSEDLDWEMI